MVVRHLRDAWRTDSLCRNPGQRHEDALPDSSLLIALMAMGSETAEGLRTCREAAVAVEKDAAQLAKAIRLSADLAVERPRASQKILSGNRRQIVIQHKNTRDE